MLLVLPLVASLLQMTMTVATAGVVFHSVSFSIFVTVAVAVDVTVSEDFVVGAGGFLQAIVPVFVEGPALVVCH